MRLADIASALGAELDGDGSVEIQGLAAIEHATAGTLTFLADRRLERHLATTGASAVILPRTAPPSRLPALRVEHPYLAFVDAIALFHPPIRPPAGVHPTAVLSPSARLGPGASVGAHVVVGDDVVIGADAVLHANVTIYPRVRAGDGFLAYAGVVVREEVVLGDRVTLHAGCVIGSDGFGYVPLPDGPRKIPQVGTVVLEDDVEIGANATVDRATIGETRIGRGTKIDNLVIVAHGCRLGPGCLLAAQVGLAGGTTLGAGVMMGGQAGSAGHLTVGDRAQIAAQTGLHRDVAGNRVWSGTPAVEARVWRRFVAALPHLPGLVRRLRRVERALGLQTDDGPEAS